MKEQWHGSRAISSIHLREHVVAAENSSERNQRQKKVRFD